MAGGIERLGKIFKNVSEMIKIIFDLVLDLLKTFIFFEGIEELDNTL